MTTKQGLCRKLHVAGLAAVLLFAAACDDDPSAPPPGGGDPEVISRIAITLTPQGGGAAQSSIVTDPDGMGTGQNPSPPSATLTLTRGVTYDGDIQLANDITTPVVDVDEEVSDEADFHRFVYTFSCTPDVDAPEESFDTDNQDPPQPLGLTFDVVVAADATPTSDCTMNVELRHFESDKGDGLGSGFDTDLDLDFPVAVQ
jgi:hypothetical protein